MEIFIFLICACLGILSGFVYDILYVARSAVCGIHKEAYTVKDKLFTAAADILYLIILTAAYIFISVVFDFYEPRLYMILGVAIGVILYLKSIHIFVAFCVKRVYNSIVKKQNAE